MMDTRIPLQSNTMLKFTLNDGGCVIYQIDKELGRGGSCIVYEASYINNHGIRRPVRIKECYPFKLMMKREHSGLLTASTSDEEFFRQYKEKMRKSFDRINRLFNIDGLTNQIVNTVDIYEGNNTVYIVTSYLQGTALSQVKDMSLKDMISVVKGVAKAIQKIHEKGYLYLDTKPENVFVIEGTTELVQLFDFDSLIPMAECSEKDKNITEETMEEIDRISFTRGYAAMEVQQGQIRNLGPYSDVYGVGALLFSLLFGRVPMAFDCEIDSEYFFETDVFRDGCFQDRLYRQLTEFFHKTIVSYFRDRYLDMQTLITKLEEIRKLSDPQIPFLHSSHVNAPACFLGRENELQKLLQWGRNEDERVMFLSGMGGIGKSVLCHEYLSRYRTCFDTVVYVYFKDSLKTMLTDDRQIWINTLEKMPEESSDDYYERKIREIRKLAAGTKTLLVIDNYEWHDEDQKLLHELVQIDWKILILTRDCVPDSIYTVMYLTAIEDKDVLYQIFQKHMGRELSAEELSMLDIMIRKVGAHTLTLELLAKQISASYLTMEKALELMERKGFTDISSDKVDYVHDYQNSHEVIIDIITSLFKMDHLSVIRRTMLKLLSVFPENGLKISEISRWMGCEDHEDIYQLKRDGWISLADETICLHPVICEVIRRWKWKKEYLEAFEKVMDQIYDRLEDNGNNIDLICISIDIISYCYVQKIMLHAVSYARLVYITVTNMSRDAEVFMIASSLSAIDNERWRDIPAKMELYDQVIDIFLRRKDLDGAFRYLGKARELMIQEKDPHVTAQYYSLEADFYDARLDGAYYDDNEHHDNKMLLRSVEKAIHFMKRSKYPGHERKLGQYMISKAAILVRSYPDREWEIRRLILSVKEILKQQRDPELLEEYHMVCGWYYTINKPNPEKMRLHTRKAYDIYQKICNTDLDFIHFILIPTANMYLELEMYEEAEYGIEEAVGLCRNHKDLLPYRREERELYLCMYDIYALSGQEKKRLSIEKKLKEFELMH